MNGVNKILVVIVGPHARPAMTWAVSTLWLWLGGAWEPPACGRMTHGSVRAKRRHRPLDPSARRDRRRSAAARAGWVQFPDRRQRLGLAQALYFVGDDEVGLGVVSLRDAPP